MSARPSASTELMIALRAPARALVLVARMTGTLADWL